MARTVLSLALLACLGLAILHLVSAQEQNQELEDKAINNAAIQINSQEHQIRILREADAKKGDTKPKKGNKSTTGRKHKDKKKNGQSTKGKGKDRVRNVGGKGKGKKGKGKVNKGKGRQRNSGKCRKRNKNGKCTDRSGEKGKGRVRNGGGKGKGKKGNSKVNRGKGRQRNSGKCRKKNKNGKCRNRSGRKGKKVGKNGGRKGKKYRSNKKGKEGKKGKKNEKKKPYVLPEGRQTCDVEALCQKIKNYIKYSNQLRKLRRINKTCSTMEKKRDKASAGEFTASGTANDDSDNTTVQAIADKLKNCTTSAKEKCETKAITGCTNTALNAKCEVELDAWIKKFGPAQGSCLQASASCCACINAITPDPSADCLEFEPLDKASKDKKKECTGSGTDGSFGHCRKLQMQAAEKGPQAHKEKCKDDNKVTTAKPSGRRMIFRNKLMKKFVKS